MEIEDVGTVAVLGAGKMGHGIAELAALAGYDVTLSDVSEDSVQRGVDQIEWSLGKLVEAERITDDEADAALARIEPVTEIAAAAEGADVVIEAVPERMDVKTDVYADLEPVAPAHAVFATNTSSLSISELGSATDRPERFCGMHFFAPPVRMQLVEVTAGADTNELTLDLVADLAESMGKTPIRVRKDSPGFVFNRVVVPMLNEAAWLVHDGEATVAEIDSTTKYDLGLPMGCFELADQVGIDIALHVLEHLHEELGDTYEPCPLLREKVETEELGQKTDEGFYDYGDGGATVPSGDGRDDVRTLLVACLANETAALVADDVADIDTVDRAVTLGGGFPDGPSKLADKAGLDVLVATLDDRREETGAARYEVVPYLRTLAESNEAFRSHDDGDRPTTPEYETIRVERDGAVGRVVLDREHRMNTVTTELLDELVRAFDEFDDDDGVRAVLLSGAGDRAFSAGADVQSAASGGSDTLAGTELSRRGQQTFARIESSEMPVVAGIDGYCLGGGMELAMAADLRVASARSEFGQTEHDLGLMPGWGGTQRLPRIVGEGRAKEMILTADRYDAETMAEYGFLADVVPNDELDSEAMALATDLADGPPIAQRLTKRAIHAGRDDRKAGFEVEAQAFGHLMATDDLIEGVTAFMDNKDPEFEGT